MRCWPFGRRRDQTEEDGVPAAMTTIEEARAARRQSEAGLRHAQARQPSVRETAGRLRSLREVNHLAADITTAMHRRG